MSRILDPVACEDEQRRKDLAANDAALDAWVRQMARDVAAAHPLTPTIRVRASGNHLAAQNDEPEPFPIAAKRQELAEASLREVRS